MDVRPLLRGFALKCPACGRGRLFRNLLVLLGLGFADWRGLAWLLGWGVLALILAYPSFKGAWIGLMQAAGGLGAPGENTRP